MNILYFIDIVYYVYYAYVRYLITIIDFQVNKFFYEIF